MDVQVKVSHIFEIHRHTQEDSSIWRLGRHHSTRAAHLPCSESGKKREEICFLSSPILSVLVQTSCIPSTSCLLLTNTDGCFSLIQTLSHSLSLCSTFPSSLHLALTFLKSYRMLSSTKRTLLLEQRAEQ